jgi:hypothetical protein
VENPLLETHVSLKKGRRARHSITQNAMLLSPLFLNKEENCNEGNRRSHGDIYVVDNKNQSCNFLALLLKTIEDMVVLIL